MFEATLEVTYFRSTVRIWVDVPNVYPDVDGMKWAQDQTAQRLKLWLQDRWASSAPDGTSRLQQNRKNLLDLFSKLENLSGIVRAQLVEQDPSDPDIKRGFTMTYDAVTGKMVLV